MSQLLQYVISGVAVGTVFGLVALGFVIIYNVTGVVNFAQGTFPMLGGLLMVSLVQARVPLVAGLIIDAILIGLFGLLVCAIAVLPFRSAGLARLVVTLGLSIAVEGAAMFIWSFNPLSYEPFTGSQALFVFGAAIYPQALWAIGIAIVLVALAYGFFEFTFLGKAVRACSMSYRAAQLVGIDINLMAFVAFALSASTGALVGAVITPLETMSFNSDITISVNGFSAAIFGGLENPMAAVAGGVALGIIEVLAQGYIGHGWDLVFALGVMMIALVVRPQGLFANLLGERLGASG